MALYYDLPVFKEVYKLILVLFEVTKDFPKEYKHMLGHDIKRDGINLVRSIYRANKAKNKVEYLEAFLDDFELIKLEGAQAGLGWISVLRKRENYRKVFDNFDAKKLQNTMP